jgi:hypothetical protein
MSGTDVVLGAQNAHLELADGCEVVVAAFLKSTKRTVGLFSPVWRFR